jgi:hypothetical protein
MRSRPRNSGEYKFVADERSQPDGVLQIFSFDHNSIPSNGSRGRGPRIMFLATLG